MTEADRDFIIGERLRLLRKRLGLSLAQVEPGSGGEVKMSVLGAYERGERTAPVHRLYRLAELYGTNISTILPGYDTTPRDQPLEARLRQMRELLTTIIEGL